MHKSQGFAYTYKIPNLVVCWLQHVFVCCCGVLVGAHRRASRQLSLDAIENQLRSLRMLQILNKSNHDIQLEVDKLQSELLARGRLACISCIYVNLLVILLIIWCND